jgi:hypothetical protein
MTQAVAARPVQEVLHWPGQGFSHVPMQVFSDPEIYRWEQDLIFRGPTWHFLGLEIEAPRPNDFFTSVVGDTPIIVVRTADGSLNALVNRASTRVQRSAIGRWAAASASRAPTTIGFTTIRAAC